MGDHDHRAVGIIAEAASGADAVALGNRAWLVRERVTTLLVVASPLVAIMSFVRDPLAAETRVTRGYHRR
ncbi:MAG TPA: hypothetical protein VGM60_09110 [Pseudonocardia sp.]